MANRHLTMRWSERRTAVRCTSEMTSTLPLRATRALHPPSLILFSLGRTEYAQKCPHLRLLPLRFCERVLPRCATATFAGSSYFILSCYRPRPRLGENEHRPSSRAVHFPTALWLLLSIPACDFSPLPWLVVVEASVFSAAFSALHGAPVLV